MREIQSSDIETRLPQFLSNSNKGETIRIKRQDRSIARLILEATHRTDDIRSAIAEIKRLRAQNKSVSVDEILDWRHEGHGH